jgi:hypothetical protein
MLLFPLPSPNPYSTPRKTDRTRSSWNAFLHASSRAKSPQLLLRVCPVPLPDENPDGGRTSPLQESRLRFDDSGLHSLPRWKVSQAPMRFASCAGTARGPRWRGRRTSLPTLSTRFRDQICGLCGRCSSAPAHTDNRGLLAEPFNNNNSLVCGQFAEGESGGFPLIFEDFHRHARWRRLPGASGCRRLRTAHLQTQGNPSSRW